MQATRQAVITGIGVISPLGIGREPFWDALSQGVSGIRALKYHDNGSLPIRIGGEIPDFKPQKLIKQRKSIKLMCREVASGVAVAELAADDAGIAPDSVAPERFGVIYGSEMLYGPTEELQDVFRASVVDGEFDIHQFGAKISTQLFPLWMLKYLPNMAACHVGIAQQACGPNNTIVQGDASATLALIEATAAIQRGWADVMIAGGCGSRLNPALNVYLSHHTTAGEHPQPEQACRPFDAHRSGQVLAEGAGALVVESLDHAQARGANILGFIEGFGRAFEARRADGEYSGNALRRIVRDALAMAKCRADALDHVNADGLGTRVDDRIEASAIHDAVGNVPVTALKGYFGNMGAGVGTVELAASLIGMQQGQVPPIHNYTTADPECPIHPIAGEARPVEKRSFLKISQSSTGQCAAVVIRAS